MKLTDDTTDMDLLWLDPSLGDGLVDTHFHSVAIGKPKDFFRVNPDPTLPPPNGDLYPQARRRDRRAVLHLAPRHAGADRGSSAVHAGYRRLPRRLAAALADQVSEGSERDNEAWSTARAAARAGIEQVDQARSGWRAYQTRDAQPGYAPDPDFSKLPPFDELVKLAFGEHGVIRDDERIPIYRELFGVPNQVDGQRR